MRDVLIHLRLGWIAVYLYLALSPCYGQEALGTPSAGQPESGTTGSFFLSGTSGTGPTTEAVPPGSMYRYNGDNTVSAVPAPPFSVDTELTVGSGDDQIIIGHGKITIGQGDEKMILGRNGPGWVMRNAAIVRDGADIPPPTTGKPKEGDSNMGEIVIFVLCLAGVIALLVGVVVGIACFIDWVDNARIEARRANGRLDDIDDAAKRVRSDEERSARIKRAAALLKGDEELAKKVLEV